MSESLDLQRIASDPAAFRDMLRIDVGDGVRPLGDVADPWQRADFAALDSVWRRLAGRGHAELPAGKQRAYLERPRGHSKTGDMAAMACWAIAFANRQLVGIAAARDADQAKLLRDAIERLVRLNPWLAELLSVNQWTVANERTGSALQILSADVASAFGYTPHFILCDEVVHWPERSGQELWQALFSSAAKVQDSLLVVISNAGFNMGSGWPWRLREAVRTDPDWYFSRLDGPQASWITEANLAEQRRLLPASAFARLWLNRWTAGAGDALAENEIDAALTGGEMPDGPESGIGYGMGLDLGLSRDAAALVVVGRDARRDRYRLAYAQLWKPTATKSIDLDEVEAAIKAAHQRWRWSVGLCDPWQGAAVVGRLLKASVPAALHYFTTPALDAMARHLLTTFRDGRISLWHHARLVEELRATSVVEKQDGKLKLIWPRDGAGHGDAATAFTLALMAARSAVPRSTNFVIEVLGAGAFPVAPSASRLLAGHQPQPFIHGRDVFGRGRW